MECRINEINFLICLAWEERELLHSISLYLAFGRSRLYLLPWLEKSENSFRSFDIPCILTRSVFQQHYLELAIKVKDSRV